MKPGDRVSAACLRAITVAVLLAGSAAQASDAGTQPQGSAFSASSLKNLSIDELLNLEVTSVSRSAEPLSAAAAAIFVITREDVLHSGAGSLPELLRLAPNLQVAQNSSNTYAITARGFNGTTANKLLVLIDGRSVYTPLFSGVFWDVQAVMPEDIERIEVISGPGAALWGPNAVNGVINIITRSSLDTSGTSVTVAPGSFEKAARLRHGGTIGENATWRIYGMGFQRDNMVSTTGAALNDEWHNLQGGVRFDWSRGKDSLTLQGDFNDAWIDQNIPGDQDMTGHNLLGRWTRGFSADSELQVQVYYDYSKRQVNSGSGDEVSVYDVDIQHSFPLGPRHDIVWGGGYRISEDRFVNPPSGAYVSPVSRDLDVGTLFFQDTMALADDLKLTLGTKLENNTYTGFKAMPSARLSWTPSDTALLWGAVSRAVRTPSRIDRDVYQNVGTVVALGGGPDFKDEKLVAYELGYRAQIRSRASLSISAFYNDYQDLRSFELSPTGTIPTNTAGRSGFLPIVFGNKMRGHSYGMEIWGDYQVTDSWRLTASYNALRNRLRFTPDSLDVAGIAAAGNDPRYQASLRSAFDLPYNLQLNVSLRRIGALPSPAIPAYTEADARLGWHVRENLELSLSGFSLLHKRHREFGASEVPRSGILNARWEF